MELHQSSSVFLSELSGETQDQTAIPACLRVPVALAGPDGDVALGECSRVHECCCAWSQV